MSFKNTLIILTSNIGSRLIASSSSTGRLGAAGAFSRPGSLGGGEEDSISAASMRRLKATVLEEVKGFFRPELLNRCARARVAVWCWGGAGGRGRGAAAAPASLLALV